MLNRCLFCGPIVDVFTCRAVFIQKLGQVNGVSLFVYFFEQFRCNHGIQTCAKHFNCSKPAIGQQPHTIVLNALWNHNLRSSRGTPARLFFLVHCVLSPQRGKAKPYSLLVSKRLEEPCHVLGSWPSTVLGCLEDLEGSRALDSYRRCGRRVLRSLCRDRDRESRPMILY